MRRDEDQNVKPLSDMVPDGKPLDSEPISENQAANNTERSANGEDQEPQTDSCSSNRIPHSPPSITHCCIANKPEKDWWDKVKPFVEISGAVLLLVYTVYTIKMYCANKEAADAAESAADTAQKTLKQNVEAYRIDERAWVSLLDIQIKSRDPLTLKIIFINTGKTPARNFSIAAAGDVDETRVSENRLPGSGVIAPGGTFSSFMQANGSLMRSTKLTVHGRVDYESVFSAEHWTTFCYYLVQEKAGLPARFAPCQSGNDTDSNSAK